MCGRGRCLHKTQESLHFLFRKCFSCATLPNVRILYLMHRQRWATQSRAQNCKRLHTQKQRCSSGSLLKQQKRDYVQKHKKSKCKGTSRVFQTASASWCIADKDLNTTEEPNSTREKKRSPPCCSSIGAWNLNIIHSTKWHWWNLCTNMRRVQKAFVQHATALKQHRH